MAYKKLKYWFDKDLAILLSGKIQKIYDSFRIMKSTHWEIKPGIHSRRLRLYHPALVFSIFFAWCTGIGHTAELTVRSVESPPPEISDPKLPDQLPQSRTTRGYHNITVAWLAGPTDRYRHGVLGDDLEATRLVVETRSGNRLQVDLPLRRVFEDLEPRLADINGDSHDEIIVVESDTKLGASLALYGIVDGQLKRIAATPFLGQPHRWLNPLGVGDFDGNGKLDIALIATPHIGGKLQLFRYNDSTLSLFAEWDHHLHQRMTAGGAFNWKTAGTL